MKTQQSGQRWDDIVFENRNKIYGAYAIRQRYPVNVLHALLLCGGAVAGVFLLFPQRAIKELKDFTTSGTVHDPIPPPIIKPDVAKEIVPIKKTANTRLATRVTTSEVPEAKTEDVVITNDSPSDDAYGTFVEPGSDNLQAVVTVEPVASKPFLLVAEIMPSYEGGISEMVKFIQKKLRYPTYAAHAGITGTVYVSFVVGTNGAITHVEIVKGIDKSCDEEAMRVIAMMTKWKPGMQNKMPVAVRMVLPIKFVAGE